MPGMDGNGPLGSGPIGRRRGPCNNNQETWGRGFRRGGMGWQASLSPEEETALLKNQLAIIQERLQKLEKDAE